MNFSRREFLKVSAAAGGAWALGGCACPTCGRCERVPYGDTVGDRLWMLGHHRESFSKSFRLKKYGVPNGTRIDMAAACRAMDVPGCFVVRWLNLPTAEELPSYMPQFADMRRVGFSVTDGATGTFDEKVRLGFAYADKMPNLSHFVMDDFWSGKGKGTTVGQVRRVKERLAERGMKLAVVLYSDQNGLKSEYNEILGLCDEVTFWFWYGKNVGGIEEQVASLRRLVGAEKPVLLGQYMWDFGDSQPMSGVRMERQLEQTSRLLARREIDGVIFHCTPLVDMDLDAVRISRDWIRENASKRWGA